jgi:hypothetical protein
MKLLEKLSLIGGIAGLSGPAWLNPERAPGMHFSRGFSVATSKKVKKSTDSAQVQRLKVEYGLGSGDLVPGSTERFMSSALMRSALAAGVHWGRASGQVHSDIRPYLLGRREKASIFDLRWTFRLLGRALAFLREAVWGVNLPGVSSGPVLAKGRVLFIGEEGLDADNPHCFPSKLLRAAAKRCGESAMGVREANLFLLQEAGSLRPRWQSGSLRNKGARGLASTNTRGGYSKGVSNLGHVATQKGRARSAGRGSAVMQRGLYSREGFRPKAGSFTSAGRATRGGQGVWKSAAVLRGKKLPVVAIVLIGGHSEGFGDLLTAARGRGCPVVSIVDSASSLKDITYPIPGNTRSVHSLYFFLDVISYSLQKKVAFGASAATLLG